MNERNVPSTCHQVPPNEAIEIGESLSSYRAGSEPALKHFGAAVPHAPQIEDSFGSWREADAVG